MRLDSRELRVRCSPCLAVYCLSFGPRNALAFDKGSVAAGRGLQPITEARSPLTGSEGCVRAQVVDAQRRCAWSTALAIPALDVSEDLC